MLCNFKIIVTFCSLQAFAQGKKLVPDKNTVGMAFGELEDRSGFGSSNDNNGMVELLSPYNKESSLKQT